MYMALDAKKIVEKLSLKGEPARGPINLYLDKALYRDFQKSCETRGISASKTVEELMREFIDSIEHPMPDAPRESAELLSLFSALKEEKDRARVISIARSLAGAPDSTDQAAKRKKPFAKAK